MALYGIDISNWQSVTAADLGQDFVIIKATEGINFVDPKCNTHWDRAGNKLKGLYHFGRPDRNGGVAGARAEAQFFIKNIKNYVGKAVLVLDYECAPYSDDWAWAFADEVHTLTGVWPMIYMSASKVNGYNWARTAANCGLWIAGYPNKYNVPNPPTPTIKDMPYGIGAWKFWAIWQYSSSAGQLDRDIANMDAEAWGKYANPGGAPAPTPTPTPTPVKDDFLPPKGYWRRYDRDERVAALANFMLEVFPAYTPKKAKGPIYGDNLWTAIKQFQRNAKLAGRYSDYIDGNTGPKTYAALKTYGFTNWRDWR